MKDINFSLPLKNRIQKKGSERADSKFRKEKNDSKESLKKYEKSIDEAWKGMRTVSELREEQVICEK